MLPDLLRYLFWMFNRLFMVPLFRLGLGLLWGNPIWGYMMVLKTTGRKTGRTRYTPVNYAILNGNIYCLAGWGKIADWYRNIQGAPLIEILMPGQSISGRADDVLDPAERLIAMRRVLIAGGFAGFMFGFNPYTIADIDLEARTAALPVVRITPTGLGVGAGDPGGGLWLLVLAAYLIYRTSR